MTLRRALTIVLVIAVVDCLYLSWRYLALHGAWVEPHTGICSWTSGIDCDVVLTTPEARAFFVPNALLGLGFFAGCLVFWLRGRAKHPELEPLILRTLVFWLVIATLFTFRFIYLLVQLPALCPFCPWNHAWTWIALGLAIALARRTPLPPAPSGTTRPTPPGSSYGGRRFAPPGRYGDVRKLFPLAALSVATFAAGLVGWAVLRGLDVVRP